MLRCSLTHIIDISPALSEETLIWPGDQKLTMQPTWSHDSGDAVTVHNLQTTTHLGAHIDAPSHVIHGAQSVEHVNLDACIGPAVLIDVAAGNNAGDEITAPASLTDVIRLVAEQTSLPVHRLIIKHYAQPQLTWNSDSQGVSSEVMEWFIGQGGKLMGIDLASFDKPDSKTLPTHHSAIQAGVVLLEGLDLSMATPGEYELVALPLKLIGADASPVRAILRVVAEPQVTSQTKGES